MYFSKISAVALMSTAAVWASPVLDTRQNGLSCQTSSDSPDTTDVTSVINQVRGQGGICRQGNSQASSEIWDVLISTRYKLTFPRVHCLSLPQLCCHRGLWRGWHHWY